jgi:hypothetical protein
MGPVLSVDLQLDVASGSVISGTIGGAGWSVPVRCTRATFNRQHPTTFANQYTAVLSDGTNIESAPLGKGFIALSVAVNGDVNFTGALMDSTLITNRHPVCIGADGSYGFYSACKKTNAANQPYNEAVVGWLNIAPDGSGIVSEDIWWMCDDPTNTFSVPLQAIGARYSVTTPPPYWPSRDKVHVYLMMGQSNMAGHGHPAAEDKTPNLRVINFGLDNFWKPAIEPLQNIRHGVGPGLTFGKDMASADPSIVIALVPTAFDATSLSQWQRGTKLYTNAVARALLAMQWGTLKGFLWHQGENDALASGRAHTYEPRLAQMISDIRTDLGAPDAPFVVGEIGRYLYYKQEFPLATVVNKALNEIPTIVPLTGCASSQGLTPIPDGIHFSADAERTIGHEYATIMTALEAEAGQ